MEISKPRRESTSEHIPNHLDFRKLLQAELSRRCRTNAAYSLRAFARSVNVEASALSKMLKAKRPITDKMKVRIGSALGLSTRDIAKFARPSDSFQVVDLDSFAAISDWYHYAILELVYTKDFKPQPKWIARRLGITTSEVNIAVERLFRMGFLTIDAKGKWIDTSENGELSHINPKFTSDAAKRNQSQLLELSKKALQEIPLEMRNHTSAAFCFDPKDLPRAIEKIRNFRREFAREFQPLKIGKEVYQIQISFFPLTKKISGDNQ